MTFKRFEKATAVVKWEHVFSRQFFLRKKRKGPRSKKIAAIQCRRRPMVENEGILENAVVDAESEDAFKIPFIENIRLLWKRGSLCDVFFIVSVEKKLFGAHRIVLAASSEYFREILFSGKSESSESSEGRRLKVTDISANIFEIMLNFIYSQQRYDSKLIVKEKVLEILYAAEKYRIISLRNACLHCIRQAIQTDCLLILHQAILFKEMFLIHKCLTIADQKPDEILRSTALLDCNRETLRILLDRETFKPKSQFHLFMALLSWSIAECQRRNIDVTPHNEREVLGNLLDFIKFKALNDKEKGDVARTQIVLGIEEVQPSGLATLRRKLSVHQLNDNRPSHYEDFSGFEDIQLTSQHKQNQPPVAAVKPTLHIKPDAFLKATKSTLSRRISYSSIFKNFSEKKFDNEDDQRPLSCPEQFTEVELLAGDNEEETFANGMHQTVTEIETLPSAVEVPRIESTKENTESGEVKMTRSLQKKILEGVNGENSEVKTETKRLVILDQIQKASSEHFEVSNLEDGQLKMQEVVRRMAEAQETTVSAASAAVIESSIVAQTVGRKMSGLSEGLPGKYLAEIGTATSEPKEEIVQENEASKESEADGIHLSPKNENKVAGRTKTIFSEMVTKLEMTTKQKERETNLSMEIKQPFERRSIRQSRSEKLKMIPERREKPLEPLSSKTLRPSKASTEVQCAVQRDNQEDSKRTVKTDGTSAANGISEIDKGERKTSSNVQQYVGISMRATEPQNFPDLLKPELKHERRKALQQQLEDLHQMTKTYRSDAPFVEDESSTKNFSHQRSMTRAEAIQAASRIVFDRDVGSSSSLVPLQRSVVARRSFYTKSKENVPKPVDEKVLLRVAKEGKQPSVAAIKQSLLKWCQYAIKDYPVTISNFSSSWSDGMAFCALAHRFASDSTRFDFSSLNPKNRKENFQLAFDVAEANGVVPLLEVDDMIAMGSKPDWKCVFVYVQSFHRQFKHLL